MGNLKPPELPAPKRKMKAFQLDKITAALATADKSMWNELLSGDEPPKVELNLQEIEELFADMFNPAL